MDVIFAKALSLIGVLLFSILFGVAPLLLEKCIRSPKIKWVNNGIICFSGGTLLGITFLHLMPETRESVELLTHKGYFTSVPPHLPLADIIICGGFFFIYIFDELFHMLLEWAGADHIHQPHGIRPTESPKVPLQIVTPKQFKDEATSTDDHEVGTLPSPHDMHIPILTIVALSFHDIFEGLALGIQEHTSDVIFMFLSVATHKYAIAFSVSLDLLISGVQRHMVIFYTMIFSVINPLGIGLGMGLCSVSDQSNIQTPMTMLMQGVASGSLIYVVCFEVLQRHGSGNTHASGIRNTVFMLLGFIFILAMKIWLPHSHVHSENHHH